MSFLVLLLFSLLGANLADDVYWPEDQELRRTWNHMLFLDHCFESDEGLNERDVDKIKGMIRDLIRKDETGCTNDRRSGFVAAYVRLAWHDAATFSVDDSTGGAHGCMRLPGNPENEDPDNVGLDGYYTLLKYIHNFYGDRASEADVWVLAAITAIEYGGGPLIPYNWGREDSWDYDVGYADRLPQGYLRKEIQEEELLPHLREIFRRLGFKDVDHALVALSGAHNLGGIRNFRSGFVPETTDELPWSPLGVYFHNAFYSELIYQRWWESASEDPGLRVTVKSDNRTFMLHSDQALLYEQHLVDMVEEYANDKNKWFDDFSKCFQQVLEISYGGTLKAVRPAYLWEIGEWQTCSKWCGAGIQDRELKCLEYPSRQLVADEYCEWSRYGGEKPNYSQQCNSQSCGQYVWTHSDWTECTKTCGAGTHMRDVQCMDLETDHNVDTKYCEDLIAPVTLDACNLDDCGYWQPIRGTEGVCDISCENSNLLSDFPHYTNYWTGSQTAEYQCVREFEGNPRVVGDEWCDEYEKAMYSPCLARFCIDRLPHWQVSPWSECSAECDGGTQTREASCWAKLPPDHLVLQKLSSSDCLKPPTYVLPAIPNEYKLPNGVKLPDLPPQWSTEPPITQRVCNVRQCKINVKKDGSVVEAGSVEVDPKSSSKSKTSGSAAKSSKHDDKAGSRIQAETDTAEREPVDVSLIIGLSFAAVVVLGTGYYLRKRYVRKSTPYTSIQTEPTALHDLSGPSGKDSYQNPFDCEYR